jgi:hypothetical protein
MFRQAHHERNQYVTVYPEIVEEINQRFPAIHHNSILLNVWFTQYGETV